MLRRFYKRSEPLLMCQVPHHILQYENFGIEYEVIQVPQKIRQFVLFPFRIYWLLVKISPPKGFLSQPHTHDTLTERKMWRIPLYHVLSLLKFGLCLPFIYYQTTTLKILISNSQLQSIVYLLKEFLAYIRWDCGIVVSLMPKEIVEGARQFSEKYEATLFLFS